MLASRSPFPTDDSPVSDASLTLRGRPAEGAADRLALLGPAALTLLGLLAAGTWLAVAAAGWRHGALWLTGAGLGFVLYRTAFGFAGPWRTLLVERRGRGFRAQLLLLAALTVCFFPLLAIGEAFGTPLADVVRPVGAALLAGAFLFGIGARLASACSSGSLAAVGHGQLRYVIVLGAMVVGATLGSAHAGWWDSQPRWLSFSMLRAWGPWTGAAANLLLIGGLAALTLWLERSRHGDIERPGPGRVQDPRGPWPLLPGVGALALLCVATLLLAGRPWQIMSAPPLWGAKLIDAWGLPFDVAFWDYWAADARFEALGAGLWTDVTTVMIGSLILGTALAAARAGRLRLDWRIGPAEALRATVGGLLLGYGGVVGLGCNIGAFVAGIASGSLHGWLWLAAALAGTATTVVVSGLVARRAALAGGHPPGSAARSST